jgi:hypothetical protein
MSEAMIARGEPDDHCSSLDCIHEPSKLLQLPETALDCVLQQLDTCSLASTATACSKLRKAVSASVNKLEVRCRTPNTFHRLNLWLAQHSGLTSLIVYGPACYGNSRPKVDPLPCPKLRHLQLRSLDVQLGPVNGLPGVLQDCTRLTTLDLQRCDTPGVCAAVAALPDLRHLVTIVYPDHQFPAFQHPTKLTHLSMSFKYSSNLWAGVPQIQGLDQLATLVNLEHVSLSGLPIAGVPGGWPSQLMRLTHLDASYPDVCNCAEQFSTSAV